MKGLWRYLVLFALPGLLLALLFGMALEPVPGLLNGTLPANLFAAVLTVLAAACLGALASRPARRRCWDYFTHAAVFFGIWSLCSAQTVLLPWYTPAMQAAAGLAVAGGLWGWMAAAVTDRRMVTAREAWSWTAAVLAGGVIWQWGYATVLRPYCTTAIHWVFWCCVLGWLIASPLIRKGRRHRKFWFGWLGLCVLLGYFFPPVFLPPPAPSVQGKLAGTGWHWFDLRFTEGETQQLFCREDGGLVTDSRGNGLGTDPADGELADTALAALLGCSRGEELPAVLFLGPFGSLWAEKAVDCRCLRSFDLYPTLATTDRETAAKLNLLATGQPLAPDKPHFDLIAMTFPPQSADHLRNRKNLLTALQLRLNPQGAFLMPVTLADSPEWKPLLEKIWPHRTLLPGGRVAAFSDCRLDFSLDALERKNQRLSEKCGSPLCNGVLPILYAFPPEPAAAPEFPERPEAKRWRLPEYDWCSVPEPAQWCWFGAVLAVLAFGRGLGMVFRRRDRSRSGWEIFRGGAFCGWCLGSVVAFTTGEPLYGNDAVWLGLILTAAAWLPSLQKLPLRASGALWCICWWLWGLQSACLQQTFWSGGAMVCGTALLAGGMAARTAEGAAGTGSPRFFAGALLGCGGVPAALAGGAPWWFFSGIGMILMLSAWAGKGRSVPDAPPQEGASRP